MTDVRYAADSPRPSACSAATPCTGRLATRRETNPPTQRKARWGHLLRPTDNINHHTKSEHHDQHLTQQRSEPPTPRLGEPPLPPKRLRQTVRLQPLQSPRPPLSPPYHTSMMKMGQPSCRPRRSSPTHRSPPPATTTQHQPLNHRHRQYTVPLRAGNLLLRTVIQQHYTSKAAADTSGEDFAPGNKFSKT